MAEKILSLSSMSWFTEKAAQEIALFLQEHIVPEHVDDVATLIDRTGIEINNCVVEFNEMRSLVDLQANGLINAAHLKEIGFLLPSHFDAITVFNYRGDIRSAVLNELRTSSYFKEVWEISNPNYLIINIVILIYRTTLLHLHPHLRDAGAQISSTIEEMAAQLATKLFDHAPGIFAATKHWILNWEEEGFSEELANAVRSLPES